MPEWKALNVGVESEDVAQDQTQNLSLRFYVPVQSKLKHPPPAYPGHLTSFLAREGGNLINLVFPGAGI